MTVALGFVVGALGVVSHLLGDILTRNVDPESRVPDRLSVPAYSSVVSGLLFSQ